VHLLNNGKYTDRKNPTTSAMKPPSRYLHKLYIPFTKSLNHGSNGHRLRRPRMACVLPEVAR
jgi:hypothetical protein